MHDIVQCFLRILNETPFTIVTSVQYFFHINTNKLCKTLNDPKKFLRKFRHFLALS
jgi:hypothetical protein